jgi:hypothetical protein
VYRFDGPVALGALRLLAEIRCLVGRHQKPPRDEPADPEEAKRRLRALGLNMDPPTEEEFALMKRCGITLGDARHLMEAERIKAGLKVRGIDASRVTPPGSEATPGAV